MPLNSKVTAESACVMVQLRRPGGWKDVLVPLGQLDSYNADTDGYAAAHFGLPVDKYIEWVEFDGTPLCGGQTAKGRDCKNMIGRCQMSANEWYNSHREGYCKSHGG